MLRFGIRHAKDNMNVSRINLGGFKENTAARRCYEAAGLREYGRRKCEMPIGTRECIDMVIMEIRDD